jgi:hypothetical protein
MKHGIYGALAITAFLANVPAHAQSVSNGYNDPRIDSRLQLGITIPFGGQKQSDYRQPRLEISSVRSNARNLEFRFRPEAQREIRRSFAFTLEDKPKMMIDGRFVQKADERNNISTGAAIGIGVVAILGATIVILAQKVDDVDDFINTD